MEEEFLVAQNDMPAPPPAQRTDNQSTAGQSLPQTGGDSDLQLMTGLVMFGGGIAVIFASRGESLT
jgi:LPXTG-motif cell wall-anchored protein